jgi:hypothetical protein
MVVLTWYPKKINSEIYRTLFCLFLCGSETWSLTLREKQRLRVYENRVLMKIFGPIRDEVTGVYEELYDLYS